MDSALLLKFIGYFPDYLSALSRTLLRFFGQPLSKQLYTHTKTFMPLSAQIQWCVLMTFACLDIKTAKRQSR